MKMKLFKNPNRRRKLRISYQSPQFTRYYDLDLDDLNMLVMKLQNNERLTEFENERYGWYILTLMEIVLENNKFKTKPAYEKEEIRDYQYYDLLCGLTKFNFNKGSSIFSYGYRIGYTAALHYYKNKSKEETRKEKLQEYIDDTYKEYLDEITSHKVNNVNIDRG